MIDQITTSTQPLLAELREQIQTHYGKRLAGLVLFGSQARGDAVAGSDIDLLVVLHDEEQPADKTFARELVYNLLQHHGILPSLLHVTLNRYLHEQSPLMINVRREGILLTNGNMNHLLHTALQQTTESEKGMTPEQAALLQKATDSLRAARLMANDSLYGFAASRAYYTMFYVAQALLLSKGLSFSKHSAVIAAFGKHFAHPGIVPVAFHRHLIDAQEARLIGDYAPQANLTEPDVATLIVQADAFVDEASRLLAEAGRNTSDE
jgi:uncharacterized protein (UPF0332 family)/predicted nucleotidyltransferase